MTPDNSDASAYIDLCACADTTQALLLDTNNVLWVLTTPSNPPIKSAITTAGKVIKIAGGYRPNYNGNALALTDNAELWRGWDLATAGGTWRLETLPGIPTEEIIDLFNQGYGDANGVLVNTSAGGRSQWYRVSVINDVLEAPVAIGSPDNKQIVWIGPLNADVKWIGLRKNGTLESSETLDPSVLNATYTKLFCIVV